MTQDNNLNSTTQNDEDAVEYEHERSPLLHSGSRRYSGVSDSLVRKQHDAEVTEQLLDQQDHSIADIQTWRTEAWLLFTYAVPLVATYLLQYSYSVVTIFVAGHIGSDALAAASIGLTTATIFGYAIFEGMATALDTLCAQAYGSGNLKGVGLNVQRMMLLMAATTAFIGTIWLCSPLFFPLFLKQEDIAVMAGHYLQISLIGLPGYAAFEALKRFVQAQGDFNSSVVVLVICAPINILLNWLFVFKFEWGLPGTALAAALTNLLRPLLLLSYVLTFKRWTMQCWGGFSQDAFKKWGPMIQLSLAGSILNLSEWAAFEIMTFSSSYLSTKHIAAQTIMTTQSILIWHIPFSVGVAVTTRIGHLIGAGAIKNTKRVLIFYVLIFISIGIFDASLIYLLRYRGARFFSDDKEVQQIALNIAPYVASFAFVDAVIAGNCGVLRGFGKQSVAAYTTTIVNYCAAVPLALWLELGSPGVGLKGTWLALQGGMLVSGVVEVIVMKFMSWQKCVEDARTRTYG